MLERVGERLLHDPVDRRLQFGEVAIGISPLLVAEIDVEPHLQTPVAGAGRKPLDGALDPELIQRSGAQLGDQRTQGGDLGLQLPHRELDRLTGLAEIRFYCRTSDVGRVVHFKVTGSTFTTVNNYFRTGSGTFPVPFTGTTTLAGHTAQLPASTDNAYGNQGNNAMIYYPFYHAGANHWAIGADGLRWECDDFPNGAGYDTQHQIWVR